MTTVTTSSPSTTAPLNRVAGGHRIRRLCFAAVGVLNVGIGAVGVVVPGLPTTIFLIVATYCFARSCPALERRLLRNRFFAPYMKYVDGNEPLSRRARITATAMMWTCVSISLVVLTVSDGLAWWLGATIVALAMIGTWVIWTLRR